jgi:hypothetical protein
LVSRSPYTTCSTTDYGCANRVNFDKGVARASVPITRIRPRVPSEFRTTEITGNCLQHRMNRPSSNTSIKFHGHSYTGPCASQKRI